MKTDRQSDVMVEVIDETTMCENATNGLRKIDKDFPADASLKFYYGYGIVRTPKGTFLLDSEGTGNSESLESVNGEIHFGRTDENLAMPFCHINITGKDIGELPIKEKVNLADFIRSFGHRLESNFHSWNKFFHQTT